MGLTRAEHAVAFRARPRYDAEAGLLTGSLCGACGARSWPARAVCSRCGSDALDAASMPAEGSLLSYTTVWVKRPGLPSPYVLGQVDLGDGAMVFAHVRALPEATVVPIPVRVRLDADEAAVPRFWFEPSP